jgi:hypothetical protein
MTTTPNPEPQNGNDETRTDDRSEARTESDPIGPLYRDTTRCECGADADPDGICRKCRARASWERHRSRPKARPSSSRTGKRDSRRPDGRHPGR